MNGVQRKRACSEWRRARSRTAARGRRERESLLFRELAQELPLTPGLRGHLDKASILRLSVTYLRLRAMLGDVDCPQGGAQHAVNAVSCGRGSAAQCPEEKVLDSALGGFLLLVSQSGQIIYATDGMSAHTGISQMDLIGQSLYHFTHPSDQKEIRSILSVKSGIENKQQHDVFLRMKSVITSQGRTVNMKSALWKVLHCTVTRKHSAALATSCLVLLCHPLPDLMPSSRDVCLSRAAFLSRHTPDMRFNYCQSRGMEDLIGYTKYELLGQSVYQYYHVMDCQNILRAHLNLFSKGKASTGKYRFLVKQGGFVWMETDATVVYDSHTRQPQSIICVNYILSGTEESEVLFSLEQQEHLKPSSSDPTTTLGPVLLAGSNGSCPGITLEKPMPTAVCEAEERGEARENTFPLIETLLDWNSTKNVQNFSLQDFAEEDLDTLAPYIPMDGEDFLLTPLPEVEEEKAEMGQQGAFQRCVQCCEIEGCVWPRSSATCQSLHTSLPPCVSSQTQPAVLTCCGLALAGSQSWESVKTDCSNSMVEMFRLGKQDVQTRKRYWSDRHLPSSGNQQYTQYSCHSCGPSTASQWKKVKPDPIQIKGRTPFWTRSDEMVSGCYQVPLGFVPWAPQYRNISSSSPVQVSLHTNDRCLVTTHWKAESPWSVLPVLSCLECEVNAPLGPSSCLLYGAEILSVLDQAAFKLCP